jgi:hypothetical protein
VALSLPEILLELDDRALELDFSEELDFAEELEFVEELDFADELDFSAHSEYSIQRLEWQTILSSSSERNMIKPSLALVHS